MQERAVYVSSLLVSSLFLGFVSTLSSVSLVLVCLVSEFCYPLSPWSCPHVCLISLYFHVYSSVVQYYVKFMCLGLDRVCCFLFYFGSLLPVYPRCVHSCFCCASIVSLCSLPCSPSWCMSLHPCVHPYSSLVSCCSLLFKCWVKLWFLLYFCLPSSAFGWQKLGFLEILVIWNANVPFSKALWVGFSCLNL